MSPKEESASPSVGSGMGSGGGGEATTARSAAGAGARGRGCAIDTRVAACGGARLDGTVGAGTALKCSG